MVVTGGSKGIGRGIVRAFGEDGNDLSVPFVCSLLISCGHFSVFQWKMEPKWCFVPEEVSVVPVTRESQDRPLWSPLRHAHTFRFRLKLCRNGQQ